MLAICFDLNCPEKTVIKTNAKQEAVHEILAAWISGNLGRGRDETEPNKKEVYNIDIQLDLSDDSFATTSDTGNKSLTCGIIVQVFRNLQNIRVLDLV